MHQSESLHFSFTKFRQRDICMDLLQKQQHTKSLMWSLHPSLKLKLSFQNSIRGDEHPEGCNIVRRNCSDPGYGAFCSWYLLPRNRRRSLKAFILFHDKESKTKEKNLFLLCGRFWSYSSRNATWRDRRRAVASYKLLRGDKRDRLHLLRRRKTKVLSGEIGGLIHAILQNVDLYLQNAKRKRWWRKKLARYHQGDKPWGSNISRDRAGTSIRLR